MDAKAKKIELYLYNGTLNGMIYVSESDGWDLGGILYSCPRESTDILLNDDSCDKHGVYLLLSPKKVYVGQSTDLRKRIHQHLLKKDWWEKVILLTSKNDELHQSYITYLESSLISKAQDCGTLDCDNKTEGNKCNLDKFTRKLLDQYLNEALFILQLIGIDVFSKDKEEKPLIESVPIKSEDEIIIRAKREAIKYLENYGIKLLKTKVYSKLQEDKNAYWINPRTEYLKKDRDVILNNQIANTLYLLRIPANTLKATIKDDGNLYVRKDKPFYIDLNIDATTFIDKRSKISFSRYIKHKLNY